MKTESLKDFFYVTRILLIIPGLLPSVEEIYQSGKIEKRFLLKKKIKGQEEKPIIHLRCKKTFLFFH